MNLGSRSPSQFSPLARTPLSPTLLHAAVSAAPGRSPLALSFCTALSANIRPRSYSIAYCDTTQGACGPLYCQGACVATPGFIAGMCVLVVAVIAGITVCIICWRRRRQVTVVNVAQDRQALVVANSSSASTSSSSQAYPYMPPPQQGYPYPQQQQGYGYGYPPPPGGAYPMPTYPPPEKV